MARFSGSGSHSPTPRSRPTTPRSRPTTPRSNEDIDFLDWAPFYGNRQSESSEGRASGSQGEGRASGIPTERRASGSQSEGRPNGSQTDGEALMHGWHNAVNPSENESTTANETTNGTLLEVTFDDFGRPVNGTASKKYATKVGKIARSIVPPGIDDWRNVNWELKEEVWRSVKSIYDVPETLKDKVLLMANLSWKNAKYRLRKVADKAGTNMAEKKNNGPKNVKKEDWEEFVYLVSSEQDQILRIRGKEAREKVKALHTTGRDGIARRMYEMQLASPTGTIRRVQVYLATHKYQDISEEDLDPESYEATSRKLIKMVRELDETDRYRAETHLDRDAVAEVFGRDGRGVVRGFGGGISKTEILASAACREKLRLEREKNKGLEGRVSALEEILSRDPRTQSPPNGTDINNQTMNGSAVERVQAVVLRNMRRRAVAFGRINVNGVQPNDEDYEVLVDEIFIETEPLIDRVGTFQDIDVGTKITWPRHSVAEIVSTGF